MKSHDHRRGSRSEICEILGFLRQLAEFGKVRLTEDSLRLAVESVFSLVESSGRRRKASASLILLLLRVGAGHNAMKGVERGVVKQ